MTWTKESIQNLIDTNDRAVEKAIVRIYNLQTAAEKATGETSEHNGVGFSGAHSRSGSYFATWILRGRRLNGKHLIKARKMIRKYWKQLLVTANA